LLQPDVCSGPSLIRRESRLMDLQHINVRLLLENVATGDLDPLVPVFHDWIQNRVCDELLLDVADYRHIPAGPGVVLIGYEANYSVDNLDDRLGVRYSRKAALSDSNEGRLAQATRAVLKACQRLEAESRLEGKVRFNGRELEISINDRLLAPNRAATQQSVEPELRIFFRRLLGEKGYSLDFANGNPRKLFSVFVTFFRPIPVIDLLRNLTL
jgi:hypothetical protein